MPVSEASTDQIRTLLQERIPEHAIEAQETRDEIDTYWIEKNYIREALSHLKKGIDQPFPVLYDITAIDERTSRQKNYPTNGNGVMPPEGSHQFSVVYRVMSFSRNKDLRLKVALYKEYPEMPTITDLWNNANWYEREVYDMFGITFKGHPNLQRILMPSFWDGHPLRKEHPARATEMGNYSLPEEKQEELQKNLEFKPEEWGMQREYEDADFMFLNLGPQHPGTHGVLRLALQLDGEDIVDIVPDIGFHHRGAEKMAERQSWHSYIPYTDRVDYLGGVNNNLPYVMAVEKLAGIEVPDKVKLIRMMVCELYRISSHLVWYGPFAQDVGMFSPVFYMFNDREKVLEICESITGARMHPGWFRIGGVAQDLPDGIDQLIRQFLDRFDKRLKKYDKMVMKNNLFKARTQGVGIYTLDEAIEWGITGPGLRACGMQWDLRKARPYMGYDQIDFDIPVEYNGDSYDRARIRVEEMRQSMRIIKQCLDHLNTMQDAPYKADHPLTTPPLKEYTMEHIETLIDHFLGVSWGPVIPEGEAEGMVEGTKGLNSYYLVSDKHTSPYRCRIRAPSFNHMQMVPFISKGYTVADLLTILGSVDYVLADIDR